MTASRYRKKPLSVDELFDAYHSALRQAQNLVSESIVLRESGHHAGAMQRVVVALEELGKNRIAYYQAGLVLAGRPVMWKQFWNDYHSHLMKLRTFLLWIDRALERPILTREDAKETFRFLEEEARRLDRQKQDSTYSFPNTSGFRVPNATEFEDEAAFLIDLAQVGIRIIIDSDSTTEDRTAFVSAVKVTLQYATVLGYFEAAASDEFFEALTHAYTPTRFRNGESPSPEAASARIADRYAIIPPLIPVTIKTLNGSEAFRRFFHEHRAMGYPEWVILCVVYNIALNARVDLDTVDKTCLYELNMWAEPDDARPLPVALFVDEHKFQFFLDLWLSSFLLAIGIALDIPNFRDHKRVRRAAAHHLGLFHLDAPHDAVFHFGRSQHQDGD